MAKLRVVKGKTTLSNRNATSKLKSALPFINLLLLVGLALKVFDVL